MVSKYFFGFVTQTNILQITQSRGNQLIQKYKYITDIHIFIQQRLNKLTQKSFKVLCQPLHWSERWDRVQCLQMDHHNPRCSPSTIYVLSLSAQFLSNEINSNPKKRIRTSQFNESEHKKQEESAKRDETCNIRSVSG